MRLAVRHVFGAKAAVLPTVDHRGQRAHRPALVVDAFRFDELLHQAQLIVGIENGEIGFEARQLRVAAQHLGADGVERAQPLHALDHAADQRADALLHLARGLVGEGDAQHLSRPGAARGEDVGEAGGEHARLAGARAGQHQNRAIHRQHGFALLGVQAGQVRRFALDGGRRFGFFAKGIVQRIAIAAATAHDSSESKGIWAM